MLVYVIGYPGSGKSTFVKEKLTAKFGTSVPHTDPIAHLLYANGAIQLGKDHPFFPGTDRLAFSVLPHAIAWIKSLPEDTIVIGEGDRLACDRFFRELDVYRIYWMDTPKDVAWKRCRERAQISGNAVPSWTWFESRCTKVDNLVEKWTHEKKIKRVPYQDLTDR